ncbi:MAG: glycosyltransferase [Bacteroidota bacterium]|nr:glycosyltransferase [Bacteroidota bacterium]
MGSSWVRISLIIPVRDEAAYVEPLLEALDRPWRRRWGLEVIAVDGQSRDGTPDRVRPHVELLLEQDGQEPPTIAAARNAGARRARGAILWFLNADVRLPQDRDGFLAAALKALQRHEAAVAPVEVWPEEAFWQDRLIMRFLDAYYRLANRMGLGTGRGECHFVRRDAFEAVGGYNAALAAGEDFDLLRRLRRRGPIAWLTGWAVYESPRRYRAWGYGRVLGWWLLNSLSILLRGRSFSRSWDPVR